MMPRMVVIGKVAAGLKSVAPIPSQQPWLVGSHFQDSLGKAQITRAAQGQCQQGAAQSLASETRMASKGKENENASLGPENHGSHYRTIRRVNQPHFVPWVTKAVSPSFFGIPSLLFKAKPLQFEETGKVISLGPPGNGWSWQGSKLKAQGGTGCRRLHGAW